MYFGFVYSHKHNIKCGVEMFSHVNPEYFITFPGLSYEWLGNSHGNVSLMYKVLFENTMTLNYHKIRILTNSKLCFKDSLCKVSQNFFKKDFGTARTDSDIKCR